jgi:hypothetical protein
LILFQISLKNYEPQAPFQMSEAPAYRSGLFDKGAMPENLKKGYQYQAEGQSGRFWFWGVVNSFSQTPQH